MKINRLESTTRQSVADAAERPRLAAGDTVRRVEAAEAVEPDRQRSLQQELAEFNPAVIAPFAGSDQVFQDARAMAQQLAALGEAVDRLIKVDAATVDRCQVVDDQA